MRHQIIRLNELSKILGLSKATLWRRIKFETDFPKIVRLGSSDKAAIGFLEDDVQTWLANRVDTRNGKNKKASKK